MSAFGLVLKDIRAARGLSQATLANALESTQRHVSFLETGRSHPTSGFVSRICRVLELSIAQRVNLFEASSLPNPYQRRDMESDEISAALNTIEARVLANWPFPALVLDRDWNVLRANPAFGRMFGAILGQGNATPNLLEAFVSEPFLSMVQNWDQVASILYFRLQRTAARSTHVAGIFAKAKARGLFDAMERDLAGADEIPVFVPIRLGLPNGVVLEMSSLLGHLASCQDVLVEGMEIELMVPLDEASEQIMRGISATG